MNKLVLGLSMLLVASVCAFTQTLTNVSDSLTLKEGLEEVEHRYEVRFSYLDELIDEKIISDEFLSHTSIDSIIHALQAASQLKFERLEENYIVIRPFEEKDSFLLNGWVLDESGNPLEAALIQINDRGVAVTDEKGYFTINKVFSGQKVAISHLGFDTKVLPATEFLSLYGKKVRLKSNVRFLNEFVLESYALPEMSKEQGKLVFNPEELKLVPGWVEPDIMQTIQLSPGVNSPYESAANLYIRGGTPDQNLVLWNGIKTYDQGHFFGAVSIFNPYIPQKVTLIKNGVDPGYGDRVAGIIDIKTSDEIPGKPQGTAGISMLSGDINVETPLIKDKLSVSLSARRSYADLLETPTYQRFANRAFQNTKILLEDSASINENTNRYYFTDVASSVLFKPNEKQFFRINSLLTYNELDFESSTAITDYRDFLSNGSDGVNIQWGYHVKQQNLLSAESYLINYGLYYDFMSTEGESRSSSEKNNLIKEKGVKARYDIQLDKDKELSFGYQYSNSNIQYAFNQEADGYSLVLDQGNETLNTHTAYTKYKWDLTNILIDLGVRGSHLDIWDRVYIEPRAGVHYSGVPNTLLGSTYEYRTQSVSQIRESVISDLSLENQVWTLSSPNTFPIITSHKYTSSIAYDNKGWIFEVEGYRKKLEGITSLTFGFLNPDPTDNEYRVGTSSITGADVFIQKKLNRYSGLIAYSYINTENKFVGLYDNQAFPGNWNITHTIKLAHFYQWKTFDFSLGWIWHSGKVFTESADISADGETIAIDFNRINRSILPKYHRLDFSAAYRINTKSNIQYKLGISILNLYARTNLINRELRKEPTLDFQLLETAFYGLGITPNIVFRVLW